MSRTLKVMGNRVMYNRGAWFLRVIMSSSRDLCCLPSAKKQKHDFHFLFVQCTCTIKQLFWISQRPHPIIVYNYRYVWIIYRYLGFSQISYRAFPFHLIFLSEFSVEWRAFWKLYNFGCSGNFAGKFPYHLSVFRNFQSFWLNGKCPIFPRFLYTIASDLHLISVECATSSSFKLLFTLYWQPLCYMASKPWSVN